VEAEWNKIPSQICIDLITSMSRRVAAVLKAKGGYTNTVKTGYNDTPVRSHFHRYSELSLIPGILFIAIT